MNFFVKNSRVIAITVIVGVAGVAAAYFFYYRKKESDEKELTENKADVVTPETDSAIALPALQTTVEIETSHPVEKVQIVEEKIAQEKEPSIEAANVENTFAERRTTQDEKPETNSEKLDMVASIQPAQPTATTEVNHIEPNEPLDYDPFRPYNGAETPISSLPAGTIVEFIGQNYTTEIK